MNTVPMPPIGISSIKLENFPIGMERFLDWFHLATLRIVSAKHQPPNQDTVEPQWH